jgi:hypothetical protein
LFYWQYSGNGGWWSTKERNGKTRNKKKDAGAEKMLTKGKNRIERKERKKGK